LGSAFGFPIAALIPEGEEGRAALPPSGDAGSGRHLPQEGTLTFFLLLQLLLEVLHHFLLRQSALPFRGGLDGLLLRGFLRLELGEVVAVIVDEAIQGLALALSDWRGVLEGRPGMD